MRPGALGASRTSLVLPCGEAVVIVLGRRVGLGSAFRAVEQGRGMQQQPQPFTRSAQGVPEAGSRGGDLAEPAGERASP
jgi:hypothetical protein